MIYIYLATLLLTPTLLFLIDYIKTKNVKHNLQSSDSEPELDDFINNVIEENKDKTTSELKAKAMSTITEILSNPVTYKVLRGEKVEKGEYLKHVKK